MVEEVCGVISELAIRVEGEAAAERVGGATVERVDVEIDAGDAATDLVRGELVAPADGVPDAGVVRAQSSGAIDEGETLGEMAPACYEKRRHVLERFDVVGVELEGAACEIETRSDVVR